QTHLGTLGRRDVLQRKVLVEVIDQDRPLPQRVVTDAVYAHAAFEARDVDALGAGDGIQPRIRLRLGQRRIEPRVEQDEQNERSRPPPASAQRRTRMTERVQESPLTTPPRREEGVFPYFLAANLTIVKVLPG